MTVCAGEIEQFDFATAIGIGMVDSAIRLTELCLREKPTSILFVGSAGSYGEHEIFDIVESKRATNIENSFFSNHAYSPIANLTTTSSDVSHETIVNSSNYITTDSSLSSSYLKRGIGLENMEFYAVLKVGQRFDIPVTGIFIVTNYCDSNAHGDFVRNHKEAIARVSRYIKR